MSPPSVCDADADGGCCGGGGGGGDGIRGSCYLKSSRNPILGSRNPISGVTAT